MATGITKINMERIMRDVTLEVKIIETPRFKIRKWLAIKLLWLGSRVLGCNFKVIE